MIHWDGREGEGIFPFVFLKHVEFGFGVSELVLMYL